MQQQLKRLSSATSGQMARRGAATALVAFGVTVAGFSVGHVLNPYEPPSGRVLGGIAVIGLAVPLITAGVWLWRDDEYLSQADVSRLFAWCTGGSVPLATFSYLVIVYQSEHGVSLAEPLGTVLWIAAAGTVGGMITGVYDVRRRHAFERQERTAERFSRLVETAPVPTVEFELDGPVQWNEAAECVFGWKSNEVVGEEFPSLFESDGSQDRFASFCGRLKSGEHLNAVRVQRAGNNGCVRELLVSMAPIYEDEASLPISITEIAVDITKESRQRKQLELFRTLLDQSNDSVFVIDAENGEFVDVNETACRTLGYEREALESMAVADIEATLSANEDWSEHVETVKENGPVLYEGQQVRKDGSSFPVEVNISYVVHDHEYVVAIARDITKRKQRERELTQFKQAVEHAGYAIYTTDRNGTIEYANPAFEDVTGYPPTEVIGDNPSLLQSGEHGPEYYQRLWDTILDGGIWDEDIVNQRRNGEQYIAHQTITPIYEKEEVIGFVAIQNDTTTRRMREQRISVLNRILRHNLRNSVNTIAGHSELLFSKIDDEACRVYADKITGQAQRLEALSKKAQQITKALDNTRPPATSMHLSEVIDRTVESIEERYSNARISVEHEQNTPSYVDASIKPAVDELVENAVTHSNEPNPSVRISALEGQDANHVSLAVSDDGPGIPDVERQMITQDATEKPLKHSNGMGLWLVKWVTTALGGTVTIDENKSSGSQVILSLPTTSMPKDEQEPCNNTVQKQTTRPEHDN